MKIIKIVTLILLANGSSFCQELSFSDVKDSIQSIMVKEDIPGISIAIIKERDSLFWAGGFGYRDIENEKIMTKHTTMNVASVSKNLIAMAMMILVERGQVRLSDNISSIIPEVNFKNRWSDSSPITVEMVLEHTTGFDENRFNNFIAPETEYLPLLEILNKYPNGLESRWEPGTLFSYSNINYTVAGYIIEKISGSTFEEFVKTEILNPLEMSETIIGDFTKKTDSISIPYTFNFNTQTNERFFKNGEVGKNYMQRPATFLTTSSNDMIKYLELLLGAHSDTNSLVKLSSIERMENGKTGYHSKVEMPGRYGLGNKPGVRNVRLHGHSGNAWNYADLTYNREAGIGYYLATNCSYPMPRVRQLLNEFLLQDFNSKSELTLVDDVSLAKDFEGFYEVINSRNSHMFFFDKIRFGGELKVVDNKVTFNGVLKPREFKILSNSKTNFVNLSLHGDRYKNQKYMSSLSLIKDNKGEDMIIWDGGNSMHYFKRQSYLVHISRSVALFGSIVVLLVSALIFISVSIYRKVKYQRGFSFEVLLSTLLFLMFASMIYIFIPKNPFELIALGEINVKTVMFYLLSMLFPLATCAFIFLVIRNFKEYKLFFKLMLVLNLLAGCYLSYFLYSNHFIGLQFWNY